MTEKMTLPEPMRLGAAVEAMKIIRPYVADIRGQTDPMELIRILLSRIQETQPSDSIRLVSLMYGISPEEVIDKVKDYKNRGSMFYKILVEGFTANPLPDLVNAGYMVGLIEEGWTDAQPARTD